MTADQSLQPVIAAWGAGLPVHAVEGCPGKCTARILAPALAIEECRSPQYYMNFSEPLTAAENAMYNGGRGEAPMDRSVFFTSIAPIPGPRETIVLGTIIAESPGNSSCAAYVNRTTCKLVSAIAEYPVVIEDDKVRFAEPQPYPKIIAFANNTAITNETIRKNGYENTCFCRTMC